MLYVNFAMIHYPAADDASQLMYVWLLFTRGVKLTTFPGPRYLTSVCRPRNRCQIRTSMTEFVGPLLTNTSFKSWKHSLSSISKTLIFILASLTLMGDRHVLKTNFYQPTKVALSFRLAPDFLPEIEYPKKPFGMFFVIGSPPFNFLFRTEA